MPVIVTHDEKVGPLRPDRIKKKKKKKKKVTKPLHTKSEIRKAKTAQREMRQQGILKGGYVNTRTGKYVPISRGAGFDPLPNIRVGEPKKEKYTWGGKKWPRGGSDWKNLTKSERKQRGLFGKKHGGKITYKMTGGQVVAAGYE